AEEAHAAAPSRATKATLTDALLFRAHRRLARQQPEYARMAARARRSLQAEHLIAVALSRGGKLAEAALADPDVRRACEVVRATRETFPDDPSPWACVVLRAAHPDEATRLVRALKEDERGR